MKSHNVTGHTKEIAVKESQSALRANLDADFDKLTPHLRSWLANLPILRPDAPVLQGYPAGKATELNTEGAVNFLRHRWIETEGTEYETKGLASIADTPELLHLTFRGTIWSVAQMEQRLIVARIAEDTFRCWRYHESSGISGATPGTYAPRVNPQKPAY